MTVQPKLVTVYNREGKPEQHSRANARDLINGAGYSWEPDKATTPASIAPFAVDPSRAPSKPKSQEVLDRVGGLAPPEEPEVIEDDFEEVAAASEVVDQSAEPAPEEAEENAPVRSKRTRHPRA